MTRTANRLKALGRACRSRDSAMAHRRPLVRRSYLRLVGGGAALAAVVAGSVVVSTEVTRLRAKAGALDDQVVCLEAAAAELARRWMEASGPEVVIARAREMGLDVPAEPDFVLVAAPQQDAGGNGLLHRVLAGLAGGGTANAAQPPVFVSGRMVSLDPPARSEAAPETMP